MDYIFLNALKVDKPYIKAQKFISDELKKLEDFQLEYSERHCVTDIAFKESVLLSYLQKLENRHEILKLIACIILFISFMQMVVCIYFSFDQGGLNSHQSNLLTASFAIVLATTSYLLYEDRKFKETKNKALKLFLVVRNHNYEKILKEREEKLNPRQSYPKGSPMDYLFGDDD